MKRINVYVVTRGWDYEGEEVVGVYSTLARARRVECTGDWCMIYRVRINTDKVTELEQHS